MATKGEKGKNVFQRRENSWAVLKSAGLFPETKTVRRESTSSASETIEDYTPPQRI